MKKGFADGFQLHLETLETLFCKQCRGYDRCLLVEHEGRELTGLLYRVAEALPRLSQAEELKMSEAVAHLEGLDRLAAELAELIRHVSCYIIQRLGAIVDGLRHVRADERGLKERIAVCTSSMFPKYIGARFYLLFVWK